MVGKSLLWLETPWQTNKMAVSAGVFSQHALGGAATGGQLKAKKRSLNRPAGMA